jgi:hypothetical protein
LSQKQVENTNKLAFELHRVEEKVDKMSGQMFRCYDTMWSEHIKTHTSIEAEITAQAKILGELVTTMEFVTTSLELLKERVAHNEHNIHDIAVVLENLAVNQMLKRSNHKSKAE